MCLINTVYLAYNRVNCKRYRVEAEEISVLDLSVGIGRYKCFIRRVELGQDTG